MKTCSFMARFRVPKMHIQFQNIIVFITRSVRLNDTAVNFGFYLMRQSHHDVWVVESVSARSKNSYVITKHFRSKRLAVFPVNFDKVHWCICICLDWTS